MTTAIVTITSTDLGALAQEATQFVAAATSKNTQRAYATDWSAYEAWCGAAGLVALPSEPTTVGLYLTQLANDDKRVSTIERALSAIIWKHRTTGFDWPKGHPAIREVLKGIKRTLGTATKQKAPVMDSELARMVGTLGVDLDGIRKRALITVGWFGAFRRSELVALEVPDVRFVNDGLIVHLGRSKTDQEGQGLEKGLPYAGSAAVCPVRSLRAWLDVSQITSGRIFNMCDRTVARIVKRISAAAGVTNDVSGHSLRAGFATSAAAKGKSLDSIMKQGGWKSERIARGYIRHASLFTNNPAAGLL